ncbi:MAG TPA: response regulator transcription factor [Casimicrobiaceae bacterium]|jgi:DNA-binding response OmpR family regulator|nr:response regulator transcription factor [Casimicrobiaceae bacterium]
MRLLLVEDDLELANGLVHALAQSGYTVDSVQRGGDALTACATTAYQLVVLDLGLPDIDGVEVLRRLRRDVMTMPVLILTARDDVQHRVMGLDAGGDDYLSKPFDVAELEARIRALLRRGDPTGATLRLGALAFEPAARRLAVAGVEVELTARELGVVELLMRRPGRIVSKKQIFDSVYGDEHDSGLSNVEVLVSRVRRKLAAAHAGVGIRVFRGMGYRLELANARDANPV